MNTYTTINCEHCKNNFVWGMEEQKYYQTKGLIQPRYCPICLGIMKARNMDKARDRYEKNK